MKAFLVLENGQVFCAQRFGAVGDIYGELVFTTGMTGYLETLTDPSFYGQMVIQTFPLIGNAGVIPFDFEHKRPQLRAYIVREWCQEPSNFRSEGDLDTFLKENNIIGLWDLDTRALTKLIRDAGTMNAAIVSSKDNLDAVVSGLQDMKITNQVPSVTCETIYSLGEDAAQHHVALWDFGVKRNIIESLLERKCRITVFPSSSTAQEILSIQPDGIVLSNGPGDPKDNSGVILELQTLMQTSIPKFGICLGHQLMALAVGAQTGKMKFGHRGANQPVRDERSGSIYITSQNHGYKVLSETLPHNATEFMVNANDGSCEGILYEKQRAFSVQFHPEAASGPLDTRFLFDDFIRSMED